MLAPCGQVENQHVHREGKMMSFSKIWNGCVAAACIVCPVLCATPGFAQDKVGEDQAFFITFQVPGSTDTSPAAVNNAGMVAGTYATATDPYQTFHGFVRDAHGAITTFDVSRSVSTDPGGINGEGTIFGGYRTADNRDHGFVRSTRGAMTSFDVPGSDVFYTFTTGINDAGTITGYYAPEFGSQDHGFVRDASGAITTFDVAGSLQTFPRAINAAGAVVGNYLDDNDGNHGFLRDPSGTITTIDDPESRGPNPWSINGKGTMVGVFSRLGPLNAFIRSSDGVFTLFGVPANGTINTNTEINAVGIVSGEYQDASSVFHGFVRTANGTVTTFDPPGSENTFSAGINDFGVIAGGYSIGNTSTAFLRVPTGGEKFYPGTYAVSDENPLYIDGGFYLYGDPIVRLWPFVAGNPSQHWHFGDAPGGFSMLNSGTGHYASDRSGHLFESDRKEVWTVTPVPGGYSIKNNRTGRYLTDPAVQRGPVTLTPGGSVWQISKPK
jgi:hypothetical protein